MGKPRSDGMPAVHIVTSTSGGAAVKDTTTANDAERRKNQSRKFKQLKDLVRQLQEAREADELMIQELHQQLAKSRGGHGGMNNEEMREELISSRQEYEKLQQELLQTRQYVQHVQKVYLELQQQNTELMKENTRLMEQAAKFDNKKEGLKDVIRQKKAKINLAIEKCEKYKAKNQNLEARLALCKCQMNPQRTIEGSEQDSEAQRRRARKQSRKQKAMPAPVPEETQQLIAMEQDMLQLPRNTQRTTNLGQPTQLAGIPPMPHSIAISGEKDTFGDMSSLPLRLGPPAAGLPPLPPGIQPLPGMPPLGMTQSAMPMYDADPNRRRESSMAVAGDPPRAYDGDGNRRASSMAVVGQPEKKGSPYDLGVPAEIALTGAANAPKQPNPMIQRYADYWDEKEIEARIASERAARALGEKIPGDNSYSGSDATSSDSMALPPEVNTSIPGFRLQESPADAWRQRKAEREQRKDGKKSGKRKKQKDPWKDRWIKPLEKKETEFSKQAGILGHHCEEYVVEANGDVSVGPGVMVTKRGIEYSGEKALQIAEAKKQAEREEEEREAREEEERWQREQEEEARKEEEEREARKRADEEEKRLRTEQRAREIAERQAREEAQKREGEAKAAEEAAAKKAEEEAAAAKKAEEDRLAKEKAAQEAASKPPAAAPAAAAPAPPPKKKSFLDSSSDDDSSVGYKPPPKPAAAAPKKKSFLDSSSDESDSS